DQLKALWSEATIVPDTNIILHLMRHSPKVRSQLMEVFEQRKDALWIPYQVGAEFQLRRLDVQQQAIDAYDRLTDEITTFVNQAKNRLNQYRAHPVIDIERELSALDVYKSDFEQRMIDGKANHPNDEFTVSFERVTELFVGRVGAKPSPERIAEIEEREKKDTKRECRPDLKMKKKLRSRVKSLVTSSFGKR
ncbi:MAG TPA: PIN-like domain-containing protein, partial [Anaerolineales bacterium]|nr:PIN-like domain-containing protein [Anaerolineales bacterium]